MDRIKGESIRSMDMMTIPQVADESLTPHIVLTQMTSIHLGRLRAWSIRMRSQHQFHNDLGGAYVRTLVGRTQRIIRTIHLCMLGVLLMMSDQSNLYPEGRSVLSVSASTSIGTDCKAGGHNWWASSVGAAFLSAVPDPVDGRLT